MFCYSHSLISMILTSWLDKLSIRNQYDLKNHIEAKYNVPCKSNQLGKTKRDLDLPVLITNTFKFIKSIIKQYIIVYEWLTIWCQKSDQGDQGDIIRCMKSAMTPQCKLCMIERKEICHCLRENSQTIINDYSDIFSYWKCKAKFDKFGSNLHIEILRTEDTCNAKKGQFYFYKTFQSKTHKDLPWWRTLNSVEL